MSEQSRYPNLSQAPIEEAIISITIEKSKHSSLDSVKNLHHLLKDKYPKIADRILGTASLEVKETGISASHEKKIDGYDLRSDNDKEVLHINIDTISLHHIKPYGSWEKFLSDYKSAWNIFTDQLNVDAISNISVRYINKFTIPANEWDRHLLMRPMINSSSKYDQSELSILDSFSRYTLHSEKHSARSVVLFNMRHIGSDLEVVMDIDAKPENQIRGCSGFSAINDVLDRLRAFKNQIFFANIPTAEELFK